MEVDNYNNNDNEHLIKNLKLHCAITSCESDEYIENLLKSDLYIDINAKDKNGCNASQLACKFRRIKVLHKLIALGANINKPDDFGKISLHYAIAIKSIEIVLLLLLNYANVNASDSMGQTPLFYACQYKCEMIILLLLHYGATIEHRNVNGDTVLRQMCSAKYGRFVNIIKLLIVMNADVYGKSNNGKTAFQYAMDNNLVEIIELLSLIRNNPDDNKLLFNKIISKFNFNLNPTYEWNENFLQIICTNYHCPKKSVEIRNEILLFLKQMELSFNTVKTTKVPSYEKKNFKFSDINVMKKYLNTIKNVVQNKYICKHNYNISPPQIFYTYRIIEILVKSGGGGGGIDLNASNYFGETVVHLLCTKILSVDEFSKCIKLLIEHGADINKIDNFEMTPLQYAIQIIQCKNYIGILLQNGAQLYSLRELKKTTSMNLCESYSINSELHFKTKIESMTCNNLCGAAVTNQKFIQTANSHLCLHKKKWQQFKEMFTKYFIYIAVNNFKTNQLNIIVNISIRNNFVDIINYLLASSYVSENIMLSKLCSSKFLFSHHDASIKHAGKRDHCTSYLLQTYTLQLESKNKLFNIARRLIHNGCQIEIEVFKKCIIRKNCATRYVSWSDLNKINLLSEISEYSNLHLDYTDKLYMDYFGECKSICLCCDELGLKCTMCTIVCRIVAICLLKGVSSACDREQRLLNICSINTYGNSQSFKELLRLNYIKFNETHTTVLDFLMANKNESCTIIRNVNIVKQLSSTNFLVSIAPIYCDIIAHKYQESVRRNLLITNGNEIIRTSMPPNLPDLPELPLISISKFLLNGDLEILMKEK